jgi:glycosyl hydrolase family 123
VLTRIRPISALTSARSAVALTTLVTALVVLIPVVPALAASGPAFAVIGPTEKVAPEGPGPSATTRGARLLGARNEFVSFQVVIAAGPAQAKNVRLTLGKALSGVGGTIPAANVTIYREEYFKTREPSTGGRSVGRWPDALIPSVDSLYHEKRNAFPIDVPAKENRVAWVDVLVPEAQRAGLYNGELVLRWDSGESLIPVTLDVRNLTLPSTSSLKSLFRIANSPCRAFYRGCGHRATDGAIPGWSKAYGLCKDAIPALTDLECDAKVGWSTNYDYARLALDNRITIANSHFEAPYNDAEIANFEKYELPLINGTAETRLPGAGTTTFAVTNVVSAPWWKTQAAALGFADRSVFYSLTCDEPQNPRGGKEPLQRWQDCRKEVEDVHDGKNWPGLPNVVTASLPDVEEHAFGAYADVIAPNVVQMDGKKPRTPYTGNQRPKYQPFLDQPGNQEVWLYTACDASGCGGANEKDPDLEGWVDYTIDAAASQNRAMGWLAYQYDVSGELYYAVDQNLASAWESQWFGGNGDGTLFYPGTTDRIGGTHPIPIESLRMKLIRNGNQDYEYLKLASAHHKAETDQIAKRLYPSAHETVTTDAAVDAARRQLAHLAEPGRVTPVGSLSITPTAPSAKSPVTASFTVTNDGGAPMNIDYLLTGVRDSAGRNVDFPSRVPPTLQPGQQYTYTAPRTFAAGTYTAWAAYYDGKEWPRLSQQLSFNVP